MASLTDWLARTFFISSDAEQTAEQVKAAQQEILERQIREGKQDVISAMEIQAQLNDTGTTYFNRELGQAGAAGVPGLVASYWWLWLLLGIGLFLYLGGLPWLIRRLR